MTLRFLTEASEELLKAAEWYDRRTPGKGRDFLKHVDSATQIIERNPSSCPRVHPRSVRGVFRIHILKRFQYSIVYQVKNGDLLVVAVTHYRRRPFYWTKRLKRR